jgi:hypothetical protein
VNGFWSLTTCPDGEPATRRQCHSIGDLDGLTLDRDGSLPIRIQRAAPVPDLASNWLPTPAGRFRLVLRLYWPREEVLDRRWTPPAVTRTGVGRRRPARPRGRSARL